MVPENLLSSPFAIMFRDVSFCECFCNVYSNDMYILFPKDREDNSEDDDGRWLKMFEYSLAREFNLSLMYVSFIFVYLII